jgi:hypothetical protein
MRTTVRLGLLVAVVAAIAAPIGAWAASHFVDVPAGSTHEAAIEWMADNGVTSGCAADRYCPDDNVTRAQMATFMRNLATSGAVDAGSVDGLSATELQTDARITTVSGFLNFSPSATNTVTATCPSGGIVIGHFVNNLGMASLGTPVIGGISGYPTPAQSVSVTGTAHAGGTPRFIHVQAVCIVAPPS